MSDQYRDGETRYRNDPEFCAAVNMLKEAAIRNGWTPGELRQIAFCAALRCEMYAERLEMSDE